MLSAARYSPLTKLWFEGPLSMPLGPCLPTPALPLHPPPAPRTLPRMQVFTADTHLLHQPQWYIADGTVRPCPDHPARVDRIRNALQNAGNFDIAPPAEIDPWPALRAIHASDYLAYLQTIHTVWTAEFGSNVDVLPDTFPRVNPHAPCVRRPTKPAALAGYYCFDMAAPITAGTYQAALDSARCALSAADAVAQGYRAAYALCRPPGHHAGPDYSGGFCYLNNAALAAQYLLLNGQHRIALLDLDYHHGNGTQDIFYARNDVLFLSLHADPNTQYPYFWGHADETGAGPGAGFNHNFPLPRGTSEAAWLAALTQALAQITAYHPDALVVSLGVDAAEHDTVGDFQLSLPGFRRAGEALAALHLPTALIQEGGYNLEEIGRAHV